MKKTAMIALAAGLLSLVALPATRAAQTPSVGTVACGDGTVTYTPSRLWPPNHTLRNVTLSYDEASDDGDTLGLTADTITHDEEGYEKGSTAKHEPDWTGEGATDTGVDAVPPATADPATVTVQLNAERRAKPKDGRTYTIAVTCSDLGEVSLTGPSSATANVTVFVPHSRKR